MVAAQHHLAEKGESMLDFRLTEDGDLALTEVGDIQTTKSICQAVKIRLLWFCGEWRLGPGFGFPHFEQTFIKNPSETKLRHLIRNTVMSVEGVTDVKKIEFDIDKRMRTAAIKIIFASNEETYREEVHVRWQNTD